jgi:hypothetical protein
MVQYMYYRVYTYYMYSCSREVPVTTPTTEMAFTASGREENPVLEDSWQLASLLLR